MTLPPLNLNLNQSNDATSRLSQDGASWDFSQGDWIINLAGSGKAAQSASGTSPMLWVALAALAFLVLKK